MLVQIIRNNYFFVIFLKIFFNDLQKKILFWKKSKKIDKTFVEAKTLKMQFVYNCKILIKADNGGNDVVAWPREAQYI